MLPSADEYRCLAEDLRACASAEDSSYIKAELDYLARCYELLAEKAEKSHRTDWTAEPILSGGLS